MGATITVVIFCEGEAVATVCSMGGGAVVVAFVGEDAEVRWMVWTRHPPQSSSTLGSGRPSVCYVAYLSIGGKGWLRFGQTHQVELTSEYRDRHP